MTAAPSAVLEWRNYWTLPLAAAIGYSTAVLHTYAIGPFFAPLQEEFGWTRAQASVGLTLAGVVAVLFAVPIGMIVDRVGPRRMALIGTLLMTGSFALLGTATGDKTNWILLWAFIAFANLWLQTTVWTSAVATRFEASRGMAFAITLSGASFAATVFPLLATFLIQSYGWRLGFIVMGGIWAILVFPVMLLFFRGARDKGGKQEAPPLAPSDLPGCTVGEGLRSPAFYQLLIGSMAFAFTALAIMVHFVPILMERGTDAIAAAGIAALIGLFSIIGRLGTGFLLDRLPGHLVGAFVFLLPMIACALLLYDGHNPWSQSVAAALFGLTVGAEVDVIGYLATRYFGLRNFGVFMGAMAGALAMGLAVGPLAASLAYDRFGSYSEFLMATIGSMAIGAVALSTLGRPRFGRDAHSIGSPQVQPS